MRAVQALTETAPTLATDGVDLSSVSAIVPVLHAPGGQTFSGGGMMLGYVYVPLANGGAAWIRSPRSDYDMADASGLTDATLPAYPVLSATGRFALIPSAVTVSSGSSMTTDYVCTGVRGEAL